MPRPNQRPGFYSLPEGCEWNPLRHHRNLLCPCGSQEKAKRCCGKIDVVPVVIAEVLRKYLETHGLTE